MSEKIGKVYPALITVMNKINAVGKDRVTQATGNYKFRGIDDMYNAFHSIVAEAGLIMAPRTVDYRTEMFTSTKGTVTFRVVQGIEYDFIADDGSFRTIGPIYGEGVDTGDKATNKSTSGAHKYALLETFLVPTQEQKDSEYEDPAPPAAMPKTQAPPSMPTPRATPLQQAVDKNKQAALEALNKALVDAKFEGDARTQLLRQTFGTSDSRKLHEMKVADLLAGVAKINSMQKPLPNFAANMPNFSDDEPLPF